MIPLINGVSYAWADIICNILGTPVAGIKAVKYDDEQKKQNNWGAGRNPVNRTYGKKEATASITLDVQEVEAIAALTTDGDICSIAPFDVVVCYLNNAGVLVTHKLKNAEFTKNMRDVKEGDMEIPVECALIISHVEWNA